MKIKLTGTKALKVNLYSVKDERADDSVKKSSQEKIEYSLGVAGFLASDSNRNYAIVFDFKTDIYAEKVSLEVSYMAQFEVSEDIDSSFLDSTFAKINSPAIAYPYLRSFISGLLLNAGYEPAILPAINFVEFTKK